MKTSTLTAVKENLGEVADQAIRGEPTVMARKGKLVIIQAYEPADHPNDFDSLIQAGKDSPKRELTPQLLRDIWKRGRARAGK